MVDDGNGERKVLTTSAPLTKNEARQISPVTLAFLGDAVYSLYVRERLTVENGGKAADLQRVASKVVSAQGQSEFLEKLFPLFTEEEADVLTKVEVSFVSIVCNIALAMFIRV